MVPHPFSAEFKGKQEIQISGPDDVLLSQNIMPSVQVTAWFAPALSFKRYG